MKKFTFKTEKPTGKWKSFGTTEHYIKIMGHSVGSIDDDFPHKIRLQIVKHDINEDGNPSCVWKWVKLRADFNSVLDAKIFLNNNVTDILRLNLYLP